VENSTASSIAAMLSALYGGEELSSGSSNTTTTGGNTGGGPFGGGRNVQGAQGTAGAGSSGAGSGLFGSQSAYGGSQQGGYNSGGFGGGGGGGAFGAGRQLGPQLNTNRTITSQVLRGGQFTGLQDTVRLVVDDVNNSLIIQATPADYIYISETIRKMDILPRQALIDAKIYEVDLNDSFSMGVHATLDAKGDSSLTTGSLTNGLLNIKTFVPVGNAQEIMLMLSAIAGKTKVRVLEAPSVLALDGQQAQIIVGAEVPYPGTSFTPSVGGSTTSVQYRDTGISLIVIPRISASGNVTMDIMQEVSTPGPSVTIGEGDAPSFNKTSVQTTLSVKDGETVAIAGLIRDGNDFTRSGIPFLSSIPLVGALFGKTEKTSHRNELIILITPHVIRTPEKLQEMTGVLRDSLRNVRKYAEEKEKEHIQDMEGAREDRYRQDEESLNKTQAPKPEAQSTKPDPVPAAEKPKQSK
jgi:general secretion pathway protein D